MSVPRVDACVAVSLRGRRPRGRVGRVPNECCFSAECASASRTQCTFGHCMQRYVRRRMKLQRSHFCAVRRSASRATRAAPEYHCFVRSRVSASFSNMRPMCSEAVVSFRTAVGRCWGRACRSRNRSVGGRRGVCFWGFSGSWRSGAAW